jgi:hypothetical protein
LARLLPKTTRTGSCSHFPDSVSSYEHDGHVPDFACDGCLGTQQCWVCLGTGHQNTLDRTGTCSRCKGSARCTLCRTPSPSARALLLPAPRAALDPISLPQELAAQEAGADRPS